MRFLKFIICIASFLLSAVFFTAQANAANNVFYSVGQTTADLKTGTPTVTIAGGAGVFSEAQTGNIGVGDRVTYNTSQIAYIAAKTHSDSAHWTLVSATGAPAADVSSATVNSITREFTSLSAAIAGAGNASHINNTDLVAADVVLNIPCYYDTGADTTAVTVTGYTTGANNYIKIYTPNNTTIEVNNSQRHQGKWDDRKYNMMINAGSNVANPIDVYANDVIVEGLQIEMQSSYFAVGINTNADENLYVENCIIRGSGGNTSLGMYGIYSYCNSIGASAVIRARNNIVYEMRATGTAYTSPAFHSWAEKGNAIMYAYNNTAYNNPICYHRYNGTFVSKNNIAQNCADGFRGTFDASSNYNISSLASDAPGANSKNSTTVSFSDAANKDFHLSLTNTAAKNAGTDLSADPNFAFATDIDGQTRSGTWDIGADEGATAIYYSVGQNTNDHKTGTPTLDISNGTGTFSVAQTANNLGVGDKVTYNTSSIAYISQKISTTQWKLITATGEIPADVTGATVNSIAHPFNSISAAVNTSTGAAGANFLNTTDLYANNYQLNIPCYYDTNIAVVDVTLSGFVTALPNYIKLYTPDNVNTEVNRSQRHKGVFDGGAFFKLQREDDWGQLLRIEISNVYIEGMAGEVTRNNTAGIVVNANGSLPHIDNIKISKNLLKSSAVSPGNSSTGISTSFGESTRAQNIYVYDNILIGFKTGHIQYAPYEGYGSLYVYNNTSVNSTSYGFLNTSNPSYGNYIYKNNLAYNNAVDYYVNSDTGTSSNLSKDATSPNAELRNKTVSFLDFANLDLHLSGSDTAARNAGTDLSSEPNFAFTTDIDGQTRSGLWDIGADEGATAIYYSVGQNTNDHKTGSPTLDISSGTGTFSVAQTATNLGVGDKVTYNTSSVAYISQKISQTQWKLITVTGGTPANVTGATVNSITHVFNSIAAAINTSTGAGGASFLNSTDLYASNYQLNIPCYYDSGVDTTGVTLIDYSSNRANFIKIYTPNNISAEVNQNQRHQGVWDGYKYTLDVSTGDAMNIKVPYTVIDGLQLRSTSTGWSGNAVLTSWSAMGVTIKNNLFKNAKNYDGGTPIPGVKLEYDPSMPNLTSKSSYIVNNIFISETANNKHTAIKARTYTPLYIYNNTSINNNFGIIESIATGVTVVKNNIVQGANHTPVNYEATASGGYVVNVDAGGFFDAASDYNISNDDTAPGANSKNSSTVSFLDANGKNFHLSSNDTAAKNAGADLSADSNFAFNFDIDGQARPNGSGWDIGADEAANNVFYSVGQTTSDLKTGTPTVTIAAGAAVFSVAQTGNIGVGDRVTYNTSQIAYIAAKTHSDMAHWTLVTATGAIPADVSNATVNSVTREFTSLSAAIAGSGNASHINNMDMVNANVVLNIPAYYDSGADTTATTVTGFTTGVSNYIKIYTPNNTTVEVNNSQRHQGVWNDERYRFEIIVSSSGNNYMMYNQLPNVVFDGLQIKMKFANTSGDQKVALYSSSNNVKILNNIIKADFSSVTSSLSLLESAYGILASNYAAGGKSFVFNNVVYGFRYENIALIAGILSDGVGTANVYQYNNTLYDNYIGLRDAWVVSAAKNNIASGNAIDYSSINSFDASSTNNLSSDATAPGSNAKTNQTVSFVDAVNKDFHLSPNDTAAKNSGADLSADANLALTTDIDGQTRSGSWDIGADEGATAIYYSVGQNTNDHKTGTPTLDILNGIGTFSVAQTATNLGVGDKVTYNTSSIAYISQKISTTQWKLTTATGGTPADVTGATVNSIAHAFSSLYSAISGSNPGVSGASYLNTKDIAASNYQLNIPCYYDSGSDVTTSLISIYGWNTSVANNIKIYTPNNLDSEVIQNQRHNGNWSDDRYNILINGNIYGLDLSYGNDYVTIEGIQIHHTNPDGKSAVVSQNGVGSLTFRNNILKSSGSGGYGIFLNNTKTTYNVLNNIFYDWSGGATAIFLNGKSDYVYNNTISNSDLGIQGNSNAILKNNITQNCPNGFNGTFGAASDYNISDLASDAPGANSKNSTTVLFVDAANKDFHITSTDTAARDAGINLQSDSNFAFEKDIDGDVRDGNWDIGADEFISSQVQDGSASTSNNLENGLVGYWSFDGDDVDWSKSSGQILDKSGKANHGTPSGIIKSNVSDGKLGQGLAFDGSSSLVNCGNPASLNNLSKMTFSAWIKISSYGSYSRIISKNYKLRLEERGGRLFALRDTTGQDAESYGSQVLNLNQWYHVLVTYDDTGDRISHVYVDGSEMLYASSWPKITSGALVDDSGGNLIIGAETGAVYPWNGNLDEVRIYNRILLPEEITQLYKSGQTQLQSSQKSIAGNLVGHWTFDGKNVDWASATSEIKDASGNNVHSDAVNVTNAGVTDGKIGQGITLNGTSEYIDVASANTALNVGASSPFSISGWFKTTENYGPILSFRHDTNDNPVIDVMIGWDGVVNASGKILTLVRGSGFARITGNTVNDGSWHHFVLTRNAGPTIELFLDGASQGTASATGLEGAISTNLRAIGAERRWILMSYANADQRYLSGSFDDFRFYNKTLSQSEIQQLFESGQVTIRK